MRGRRAAATLPRGGREAAASCGLLHSPGCVLSATTWAHCSSSHRTNDITARCHGNRREVTSLPPARPGLGAGQRGEREREVPVGAGMEFGWWWHRRDTGNKAPPALPFVRPGGRQQHACDSVPEGQGYVSPGPVGAKRKKKKLKIKLENVRAISNHRLGFGTRPQQAG